MGFLATLTLVLTFLACAGMAGLTVLLSVLAIAGRGYDLRRAKTLADSLGLAWSPDGWRGRVDGRRVRLHSEVKGGRRSRHRVWISEFEVPELPVGFRVAPEGMLQTGSDTVVGDPMFDRVFRVHAPGDAIALLDAGMRAGLLGCATRPLISGGRLWFERSVPWLEHEVRAHAALARQLADPSRGLVHLAADDPLPSVRARAWSHLVDTDRTAATELARVTLHAAEPVERGYARLLLGITDGLAAAVTGADEPGQHLLCTFLASVGTPDQVEAVIRAFAGQEVPRPVWFAATAAVAAHPSAESVALVLQRCEGAAASEASFLASRAVVALLALPSPATEAHLLRLLPRLDTGLPAALDWLQAHGTVQVVQALDKIAEAAWPMSDTRTRVAAAKRAIQGRAAGDRGGLALSTGAAGQLSPADDPALGALAEVPRPPPQGVGTSN